jgi:hypothetical protein
LGFIGEQGKLVEMLHDGCTPGSAPVRSPHRLLPALSLNPAFI